jgi:hypothetical protein
MRGGAEALAGPDHAGVPLGAAVMEAIAWSEGAAVAAVMGDVARAAPAAQRAWSERAAGRPAPTQHQGRRRPSRLRWLIAALSLFGATALAFWARRLRLVEPRWADDVRAAGVVESGELRATPARAALPRLPGGAGLPTSDDAARDLDIRRRPAAAGSEGRELWRYDFEDGESPSELESGAVTGAPARAGNRFAAVGGISRWAPRTNLVLLELWRPGRTLRWDPRLVLRFDYWAAPDTRRLLVQLFNESRGQNIHHIFNAPITGRWARATVRLADLAPNNASDRVPQPGDGLINLVILGGRIAGGGLFVDDLRALEIPEGDALPPSELQPLE